MSDQIPVTMLKGSELANMSVLIMIVVVATQSLRYALGWKARWIGLLFSFLVSCLGTHMVTDGGQSSWLMMIPNAFIIYTGAVGTAEIGSSLAVPRRKRSGQIKRTQTDSSMAEEIGEVPSKVFWGGWF